MVLQKKGIHTSVKCRQIFHLTDSRRKNSSHTAQPGEVSCLAQISVKGQGKCCGSEVFVRLK